MADTKKIEEKAINALKNYIEDSDFISQFIDENDKEPCWDGALYLYSVPGKAKENLIGRVPVQIKGTEVEKIKTENYGFQINMSDLKAYLKDPTLYIVCQECGKERKLFYQELLPEYVKKIIKKHKSQFSVKVPMQLFPDDLKEFESILNMFLSDRTKQISFAQNESLTIGDAISNNLHKYTLVAPRMSGVNNVMESLKYLSSHYTYIYAKPENPFSVVIPIGERVKMQFVQSVDKEISVNGIKYFNSYSDELKDGKRIITIGNNVVRFEFPLEELDEHPLISFHNEDCMLNDYLHNTEFLIAIHNNGGFEIGGQKLYIGIKETEELEQIKLKLDFYKEVKKLFTILNVKKNLDLSKISRNQKKILDILIYAIIYKKPIENDVFPSQIFLQEIGNVTLLLSGVSEKNKTEILDFFDVDMTMSYVDNEDGQRYRTSLFSYLQTDNLWEVVDNIPYEQQIKSFEDLSEENPHIYKTANWNLLSMILAYDKLKEKDIEKANLLYDQSIEFVNWLLLNDKENTDLHKINYYQLIKRKGVLNENARQEIQSIKERCSDNVMQFATNILIGTKTDMIESKRKCTDDELNDLKSFPIWNLYNETMK